MKTLALLAGAFCLARQEAPPFQIVYSVSPGSDPSRILLRGEAPLPDDTVLTVVLSPIEERLAESPDRLVSGVFRRDPPTRRTRCERGRFEAEFRIARPGPYAVRFETDLSKQRAEGRFLWGRVDEDVRSALKEAGKLREDFARARGFIDAFERELDSGPCDERRFLQVIDQSGKLRGRLIEESPAAMIVAARQILCREINDTRNAVGFLPRKGEEPRTGYGGKPIGRAMTERDTPYSFTTCRASLDLAEKAIEREIELVWLRALRDLCEAGRPPGATATRVRKAGESAACERYQGLLKVWRETDREGFEAESAVALRKAVEEWLDEAVERTLPRVFELLKTEEERARSLLPPRTTQALRAEIGD